MIPYNRNHQKWGFLSRHVFWHFSPLNDLNCGVFQTKILVELETLLYCFVCMRLSYTNTPTALQLSAGGQLFASLPSVFWSIHHWIDQQKLMALKLLMKSWKIFWFRLCSGHFKQFGKNNLCLLNYFMERIAVLRRKSGKSET